jgi:hypothetical protein
MDLANKLDINIKGEINNEDDTETNFNVIKWHSYCDGLSLTRFFLSISLNSN